MKYYTGYSFDPVDFGGLSYHRTVEAFKFAYAQRLKLGYPAFNHTVDDVRYSRILPVVLAVFIITLYAGFKVHVGFEYSQGDVFANHRRHNTQPRLLHVAVHGHRKRGT